MAAAVVEVEVGGPLEHDVEEVRRRGVRAGGCPPRPRAGAPASAGRAPPGQSRRSRAAAAAAGRLELPRGRAEHAWARPGTPPPSPPSWRAKEPLRSLCGAAPGARAPPPRTAEGGLRPSALGLWARGWARLGLPRRLTAGAPRPAPSALSLAGLRVAPSAARSARPARASCLDRLLCQLVYRSTSAFYGELNIQWNEEQKLGQRQQQSQAEANSMTEPSSRLKRPSPSPSPASSRVLGRQRNRLGCGTDAHRKQFCSRGANWQKPCPTCMMMESWQVMGKGPFQKVLCSDLLHHP